MPLVPGTRLGAFEIVARIGAGGMGEVYRARDQSLGRDVAIKLLPERLRESGSRLRRLRREARVLAGLNHPNIGALYELAESDGVPFLVLELIAGETLAKRLARGPIPYRRVLDWSSQIASALAAAHAHGVVHRDLKPANIMLTQDGFVKLLDFGVAHLQPSFDAEVDATTDTDASTEDRVVGTKPYMSPEQTRGEKTDQRTDAWAFGCVLYEMLCGRRAFGAPTSSETITRILSGEPDWSCLAESPEKVSDLVRRCLQRDRSERLHHLADARIELREALAASDRIDTQKKRPSAYSRPLLPIVVAALAGLLWLSQRTVTVPAPTVRSLDLELEPGSRLAFGVDYPAAVAVAPTGDVVAFVAESNGERRIHVRHLEEFEARALPGTEDAHLPFFSPDGRWLGFFSNGELRKISVRGGAPISLGAAARGMGGAWAVDGSIVYAPSDTSGLWSVASDGGMPREVTRVDRGAGEQGHWSPSLLPDHKTIVFTVYTGGRTPQSRLALASVDESSHRIIVDGGSNGIFLPPKWLIYGRASEILAVEFDPNGRATTGTPFRVLDGVLETPALGAPVFGLSNDGTLVFADARAEDAPGRLVWVDRTGQIVEEVDRGLPFYRPLLSPALDRVAFHAPDPDFDLWLFDFERSARSRVTTEPGWDGFAVWSPRGDTIAFASSRHGPRTIYLQRLSRGEAAEQLLRPANSRWPTSWSQDGKWLAYHEEAAATGMDVWLLDTRTRRASPFVKSPFHEAWARFSPDGEWLAYESNANGWFEVLVASLSDPSVRLQASVGGGRDPIWSRSGDAIFYEREGQFFTVPVEHGGRPSFGRPEALFQTRGLAIRDVDGTGSRFLAVEAARSAEVNRLRVVLGWGQTVARTEESTN